MEFLWPIDYGTFTKGFFHRPGFSNSLSPCWDSSYVSQKFSHQSRGPWTKTRTFFTTLRTGTRASKIQNGEDVDVLASPASDTDLDVKIPNLDHYCEMSFESCKNSIYIWKTLPVFLHEGDNPRQQTFYLLIEQINTSIFLGCFFESWRFYFWMNDFTLEATYGWLILRLRHLGSEFLRIRHNLR